MIIAIKEQRVFMSRIRGVQIGILTTVLILVVFTVFMNIRSKERDIKEGSTAPDFTLQGMDGRKYILADYANQAVIVNFWGSFCPPCREEMPAIQKQYDKWKDKGLVVLGVNLGENAITVKSFVEQYRLSFPILYDPNLQIRNMYKVTQYPTTFFIKNGKIMKVQIGQMDEKLIQNEVERMMSS